MQLIELQLTLEDMVCVSGVHTGSAMLLSSDSNARKNPNITDGYYTINGNKDIVIHGYEK